MKPALYGTAGGLLLAGLTFSFFYTRIRKSVIRDHGISIWKQWR